MGVEGDVDGRLSKEEAAIYDRQIRLWGADAQKRMSSARVMVVGDVLSNLGNEVVKNVCLAGVGTVIVCSIGEQSNQARGYLGDTPSEV